MSGAVALLIVLLCIGEGSVLLESVDLLNMFSLAFGITCYNCRNVDGINSCGDFDSRTPIQVTPRETDDPGLSKLSAIFRLVLTPHTVCTTLGWWVKLARSALATPVTWTVASGGSTGVSHNEEMVTYLDI